METSRLRTSVFLVAERFSSRTELGCAGGRVAYCVLCFGSLFFNLRASAVGSYKSYSKTRKLELDPTLLTPVAEPLTVAIVRLVCIPVWQLVSGPVKADELRKRGEAVVVFNTVLYITL